METNVVAQFSATDTDFFAIFHLNLSNTHFCSYDKTRLQNVLYALHSHLTL